MTAHATDWRQHVFRRSSWDPRQQSRWIVLLAGFLVLIAGVIYVLQIATVADKRHQLNELLAQRNSLEHEIDMLRQAISEAQNLAALSERAAALGFARASSENIRYLRVALPASEETLAANAPPANGVLAAPAMSDPLFATADQYRHFLRQWAAFAETE